MANSYSIIDILAMLGLFAVAFFLWVSWEIITRRKSFALLLAVGTFVAGWLVAGLIGAAAPLHFLFAEILVAAVVYRVAARTAGSQSAQ
ncbi:MAG: hypothetical protein KDI82_05195 [Gammaproteobacteria bacterium]|nr:hypothetical protein [Gammaproteobacteria bacterium]